MYSTSEVAEHIKKFETEVLPISSDSDSRWDLLYSGCNELEYKFRRRVAFEYDILTTYIPDQEKRDKFGAYFADLIIPDRDVSVSQQNTIRSWADTFTSTILNSISDKNSMIRFFWIQTLRTYHKENVVIPLLKTFCEQSEDSELSTDLAKSKAAFGVTTNWDLISHCLEWAPRMQLVQSIFTFLEITDQEHLFWTSKNLDRCIQLFEQSRPDFSGNVYLCNLPAMCNGMLSQDETFHRCCTLMLDAILKYDASLMEGIKGRWTTFCNVLIDMAFTKNNVTAYIHPHRGLSLKSVAYSESKVAKRNQRILNLSLCLLHYFMVKAPLWAEPKSIEEFCCQEVDSYAFLEFLKLLDETRQKHIDKRIQELNSFEPDTKSHIRFTKSQWYKTQRSLITNKNRKLAYHALVSKAMLKDMFPMISTFDDLQRIYSNSYNIYNNPRLKEGQQNTLCLFNLAVLKNGSGSSFTKIYRDYWLKNANVVIRYHDEKVGHVEKPLRLAVLSDWVKLYFTTFTTTLFENRYFWHCCAIPNRLFDIHAEFAGKYSEVYFEYTQKPDFTVDRQYLPSEIATNLQELWQTYASCFCDELRKHFTNSSELPSDLKSTTCDNKAITTENISIKSVESITNEKDKFYFVLRSPNIKAFELEPFDFMFDKRERNGILYVDPPVSSSNTEIAAIHGKLRMYLDNLGVNAGKKLKCFNPTDENAIDPNMCETHFDTVLFAQDIEKYIFFSHHSGEIDVPCGWRMNESELKEALEIFDKLTSIEHTERVFIPIKSKHFELISDSKIKESIYLLHIKSLGYINSSSPAKVSVVGNEDLFEYVSKNFYCDSSMVSGWIETALTKLSFTRFTSVSFYNKICGYLEDWVIANQLRTWLTDEKMKILQQWFFTQLATFVENADSSNRFLVWFYLTNSCSSSCVTELEKKLSSSLPSIGIEDIPFSFLMDSDDCVADLGSVYHLLNMPYDIWKDNSDSLLKTEEWWMDIIESKAEVENCKGQLRFLQEQQKLIQSFVNTNGESLQFGDQFKNQFASKVATILKVPRELCPSSLAEVNGNVLTCINQQILEEQKLLESHQMSMNCERDERLSFRQLWLERKGLGRNEVLTLLFRWIKIAVEKKPFIILPVLCIALDIFQEHANVSPTMFQKEICMRDPRICIPLSLLCDQGNMYEDQRQKDISAFYHYISAIAPTFQNWLQSIQQQ